VTLEFRIQAKNKYQPENVLLSQPCRHRSGAPQGVCEGTTSAGQSYRLPRPAACKPKVYGIWVVLGRLSNHVAGLPSVLGDLLFQLGRCLEAVAVLIRLSTIYSVVLSELAWSK